MSIPTKTQAITLLEQATDLNPGRWVEHCKVTATSAMHIASKCNMDPEKAYVYGLLHDIGRRAGNVEFAHITCELKNQATKSNKKSFVRRNVAMKIKEGRVAKTGKASWKT